MELRQAYAVDIRVLQEELRDRDLSIEGLQLQVKARHDSALGPSIVLQRSDIALYERTYAVENQ